MFIESNKMDTDYLFCNLNLTQAKFRLSFLQKPIRWPFMVSQQTILVTINVRHEIVSAMRSISSKLMLKVNFWWKSVFLLSFEIRSSQIKSTDLFMFYVIFTGAYVPANCVDNEFFANCKLIVKAKYCKQQYYSKFCCRSCTLAGQLPTVFETNLLK